MGTRFSQSARITPNISANHKSRKINQPESNTNITSRDLFDILREEILLVIEGMLKEEIAKQMEEKLKDTKIKADQRARIYKNVLKDAKKQVN